MPETDPPSEFQTPSLSPADPVAPSPAIPRSHPIAAWSVIGLIVALLCGIRAIGPKQQPEEQPAQEADAGTSAELGAATRLSFELPAKYIVGAHQLLRQMGPMANVQRQQLYDEAQELNRGPYPMRLRFVVLAGELSGPAAALEQLAQLETAVAARRGEGKPVVVSAADRQLRDMLETLYRGYLDEMSPPAGLTSQQSSLLIQQLGWFGKLALVPPDLTSAQQREPVLAPAVLTVVAFAGVAILFLVLFIAGLVVHVAISIARKRGKLPSALTETSPYSGLYLETFALWMVLFLVFSMVAQLIPLKGFQLLGAGLGGLLSLVALAWPVFRGVPWSVVRQDLGWWCGPRPWLDPLRALVAYCAAVPLVAAGLLFLVITVQWQAATAEVDEFSPTQLPSHPIVNQVGDGWLAALQLLLMAAVVAPIVEETAFRGLLYRYFRDHTRSLRYVVGVGVSMLSTSLLFAVIHPQGMLAVPALMALACGFAIARELWGSLVPSMLAHGLHNGTLCVLILTVF